MYRDCGACFLALFRVRGVIPITANYMGEKMEPGC